MSYNIITKNIEEKKSINVPEEVNSFARSLFGKEEKLVSFAKKSNILETVEKFANIKGSVSRDVRGVKSGINREVFL